MKFESRPTQDLMQIAAAGGGFRLELGMRSLDDMMQIAAAGGRGNARLVFVGLSSRPTQELMRIAAAGKGAVFFEG